jgi:hypothetical protein
VLPKKKPAKAKREALPTIEVDVDDEVAIADVAEALVTAILAAAVERGTGRGAAGGGKRAKAARAGRDARKPAAKKAAAGGRTDKPAKKARAKKR